MPLSRLLPVIAFAGTLSLATVAAHSAAAAETPFTHVVSSHFAAWDRDHDGTLSQHEIEVLVVDSTVKGEDAAAVATLDMLARKTKTAPAPQITLDYLTQYAANTLPRPFPAYDGRFKTCVTRIAATPAGLYASRRHHTLPVSARECSVTAFSSP